MTGRSRCVEPNPQRHFLCVLDTDRDALADLGRSAAFGQGIADAVKRIGAIFNQPAHARLPAGFLIAGRHENDVAIQLVCQGVLGESLAEYPEAPLAETAGRVLGPVGATIMLVGASISMFGNLSGEMLNLPRVIYGAARDGVVPPRRLAAARPCRPTIAEIP